MLTWVDAILEYWMGAPWWIALAMAIVVHMTIYGVGAGIGSLLTERIWPAIGLAYHRLHHTRGNVNYGFTRVMDKLFGTAANA